MIHALKLAPDKSSANSNCSDDNKENLEENSQHSTPNSSLSVRGGSGPGAGGAPEGGDGADGGAAIGAVNNCDERTSLGAGNLVLVLGLVVLIIGGGHFQNGGNQLSGNFMLTKTK